MAIRSAFEHTRNRILSIDKSMALYYSVNRNGFHHFALGFFLLRLHTHAEMKKCVCFLVFIYQKKKKEKEKQEPEISA